MQDRTVEVVLVPHPPTRASGPFFPFYGSHRLCALHVHQRWRLGPSRPQVCPHEPAPTAEPHSHLSPLSSGVRVGRQRGSARGSLSLFLSITLSVLGTLDPLTQCQHKLTPGPTAQSPGVWVTDCPGFTKRGSSSNNVLYSHISISGDIVRQGGSPMPQHCTDFDRFLH